jgi:hypothetical protein
MPRRQKELCSPCIPRSQPDIILFDGCLCPLSVAAGGKFGLEVTKIVLDYFLRNCAEYSLCIISDVKSLFLIQDPLGVDASYRSPILFVATSERLIHPASRTFTSPFIECERAR